MAGAMSSMRRVLADKNKNASLCINKHAKPASMLQSTSTKPPTSSTQTPKQAQVQTEGSSPRLGQKRKIDEVEDTEEGTDSQNSNTTQPLSDLSDSISDTDIEICDVTTASTRDTISTAPSTLPSFHASQADIGPADVEFEIHEEMSQRTLDKLVSCCS